MLFKPRRLPLWTILVTVLVVAWSLLALNIYKGYREAQDSARQFLAYQAKFAEENLSRQMQITSQALDMMRRAPWLKNPASVNAKEANPELKDLVSLLPGVRSLLVVNVEGKVVASNRAELMNLSMHNTDRYATISGNPHPDMLYLSTPFLTPLKHWTLALGKMLVKGDNQFNGYVSAVMDPSYFQMVMQVPLYTEDTRVTLLHSDGKVVMRMPDAESLEGQDLSQRQGSLYAMFKETGKERAVIEGTSAVTGKTQLITFTTIRPEFAASHKALIFGISRERHKILAAWRLQTAEHVSIALILTLLAVFAVYDRQRQRALNTDTP